jgi:hypothetical protein
LVAGVRDHCRVAHDRRDSLGINKFPRARFARSCVTWNEGSASFAHYFLI